MPLGISIEPLTSVDDIDGVIAVEEASFTNPWTRAMYLAELDNRAVAHFVLAKNEHRRIVAFCSFWHVVDELHINNLAVLPLYRRQGVGAAVLTRVLEEARALGASRATLEVRRSNSVAMALYEHFGFVVAGVRRGYYSSPTEDALVLWKENLGAPSDAT